MSRPDDRLRDREDMPPRFANRSEGGRALAERLIGLKGRPNLIVLALPRGGVPVAFELARALGAPLDVMLVRKLGLPGQPELAMGAIAEGEIRVLNDDVVESCGVPARVIEQVAVREHAELDRRGRLYRGPRPARNLQGQTVILVDDGLATGSTMRAAVIAARVRQAALIIVAVPVATHESEEMLRPLVDDFVALIFPEPFVALGAWYDDFRQTSDSEVIELLEHSARMQAMRR